jgi:hypothetical protein
MYQEVDYAHLMPKVARHLLGDPNTPEKPTEWRYRKRDSLSVKPQDGTFFDHEKNVGGGTLEFWLGRFRAASSGNALA